MTDPSASGSPTRTRNLCTVSEAHEDKASRTRQPMTIDDLARLVGAEMATDIHQLAADIWESDEELDAFLAGLRACRNASLA